ncbi:MAG: hypothetical protein M3680_18605 [Myxococcota bacterium]|nr:hypothetical protein [Myxococcota bacterium]
MREAGGEGARHLHALRVDELVLELGALLLGALELRELVGERLGGPRLGLTMRLGADQRPPHQHVQDDREQLAEPDVRDLGHRLPAVVPERERHPDHVQREQQPEHPAGVQHDRGARDLDEQHRRQQLAAAEVLREQRAADGQRPHEREHAMSPELGDPPTVELHREQHEDRDRDHVVGDDGNRQRDPDRLAADQGRADAEQHARREHASALEGDRRQLIMDRRRHHLRRGSGRRRRLLRSVRGSGARSGR